MTAPDSSLLATWGPLAAPLRSGGPGPYRCGCRADLGQSCLSCDRPFYDDSALHEYLAGAWWLVPHTDTQETA